MGLGMRLSTSQSVHQRQSLSLTQGLIQKLRGSIKELRGKAYPPENEVAVVESLIENFLETLTDDDLKSLMKLVFDDNDIKNMMIDEAVLLSMPKKENINTFVYKYMFKSILEEQNTLQERPVSEEDKLKPLHERIFIQAITNKKALEDDIDRTEKLIKASNQASPLLLDDLRIKNTILDVVDEDMLQTTQTLGSLLQFLLTTKIKKEGGAEQELESDVLGFLRERVILEEITDFSSERLLKRFLTNLPSFSKKTESTNCKDLRYRTMDVIGEFMLISLGIIDPEMFTLQNFSLDSEKINTLIRNTDTTKEELELLFKYYNLRGINGKPVFYNRWFTQNEIPSKQSDQLIRDFLLKTKEHRNEIFTKFGYEEFQKNVILIKREHDLDNEEKEEAILDELNARLADENFIKEMATILSNYRYKDTYALINPSNKK